MLLRNIARGAYEFVGNETKMFFFSLLTALLASAGYLAFGNEPSVFTFFSIAFTGFVAPWIIVLGGYIFFKLFAYFLPQMGRDVRNYLGK